MIDFISRVRIRWHPFLAALLAALPILLQQLQWVDFTPILTSYFGEDWAPLLAALIPFYIALLKPMLHIEDAPAAKTEE